MILSFLLAVFVLLAALFSVAFIFFIISYVMLEKEKTLLGITLLFSAALFSVAFIFFIISYVMLL